MLIYPTSSSPIRSSNDSGLRYSPASLASGFCAVHRCPDRTRETLRIAGAIHWWLEDPQSRPTAPPDVQTTSAPSRVVVSLSTIPSRIALGRLAHACATALQQTRPPDAVHVNLPPRSVREGKPYAVDAEALARDVAKIALSAPHLPPLPPDFQSRLRVNAVEYDWGPATKLIPAVALEEQPDTLIITLDDDILYPATLVEEFASAAAARPNGALSMKGYRLRNSTAHKDFWCRSDPR